MKFKEFLVFFTNEVYDYKKSPLLKRPFRLFFHAFLDLEHSFLFNLRLMQLFGTSKSRILRYLGIYIQKRILSKYGCCTHPFSKIGLGFHVPHPTGIVIGCDVVIGTNCTIYQNVTLGSKIDCGSVVALQPVIEDDVIIYANSLVLGNVCLSKGTIVGANSMVVKDTESHSVYVGSPATKIK